MGTSGVLTDLRGDEATGGVETRMYLHDMYCMSLSMILKCLRLSALQLLPPPGSASGVPDLQSSSLYSDSD